MKIQRSHFRLITFFLLFAFMATVLLCAVRIGLISPSLVPGMEEGNVPAAEESLNQPEFVPDTEEQESVPSVLPPETYVTTGL